MRTTPSTSQNSTDEPSWSLIRLVRPTGTRKNRPIANSERDDDGARPTRRAEISSSLLGQLRVGGDPERPEADRQRLAERDDAAHDRQPQQPVALAAPRSAETLDLDLAERRPPRDRRRPRACSGAACARRRPRSRRRASSRPRARPGRRRARRAERRASPVGQRAVIGHVSACFGRQRGRGLAALEALDAAAGVDELLPARVERVAVGADLDVDLGLGRARRELVAAGAADVGLDVLGMDSRSSWSTSV